MQKALSVNNVGSSKSALKQSTEEQYTGHRLINEEVRLKLEAQYEQPENQAIYKLRKEKVELPFGHIKRNLGVNAFLLRGLDGAKTEMALLGSCFNIARMMSIFDIQGLIKELIHLTRRGIFCLLQKSGLSTSNSPFLCRRTLIEVSLGHSLNDVCANLCFQGPVITITSSKVENSTAG